MPGKFCLSGVLVVGIALAVCAVRPARAEAKNAPAAGARCDRACLDHIMDEYIAALLKHDPSGLPVAANLKSTENTKPTPLGQGVWKTIKYMKFYGETIANPSTGQVTYWGAIQENFVSLLMVRLKVENGKITEVETIVPHGSDPKAPRDGFEVMPDLQVLAVIKPFLESEIPPAQRESRAQLIAAANAYFDGIEHGPGHIPFAPGCNRIENGQLTTNNPTNSEGLPPLGCQGQFQARLFSYIPHVRPRRFPVVDETRGLVVAQVVFDIPGSKTWIRDGKVVPAPPAVANPRNNILNELFKVEHGQIQLIQAFMLPNEPYGTKTGWSDSGQ
jgi:hypothetical protein